MSVNSNCDKCGLLDLTSGPVPDDGGDYTILVVGEAPGAEEDRVGRPFVGPSGQDLRRALTACNYPADKVTFTNVVRCRPPNNVVKTKHIKNCYTSLPIKDNTRLVLLLGNTALRTVLGETGITQWNGVRVQRDGIIYAPLLHPAYFLHRSDPKRHEEWLGGMLDALDAFYDGMEAPADADYEYVEFVYTPSEVSEMCRELLESPRISFDVEFSNLDPYAFETRILAVSFANDKKAWAVPINHPDDLAPAGLATTDAVRNVLQIHPYVMGHNIKMDQMQCDVILGWKFNAKGDSMLASFLIESVAGIHSLKRLAGYYLGMSEYDARLQSYVDNHPEANPRLGGSYDKVPLKTLLPYAAMDAVASYQLETLLLEGLSPKQRILYDELIIPASNALYRMQVNGMAVDSAVADRYLRLYTVVMQDELKSVRDDPQVRQYVDDRKADLSGKRRESFEFNPSSYPQKAAVLYDGDYYGLQPRGFTEKGAPSTRREYIEPYRDQNPLVDHLVMYQMMKKTLGTYIEPVAKGTRLSGDGRARSSFNQHIVETGRLSSSSFNKTLGFNLQNITTPEKEPGTILEYQPVRNMFTHTWDGGCLMSVDYAGMELRIFASLAESDAMIDIHKSDRDFHTIIASTISGKPYDTITKAERFMYKRVHFLLLYGGSEYALNRILGIPMDEGKRIIDRYYNEFPKALEYKEKCMRFAKEHGYVETPFGNRRPLPGIYADDTGKYGKAAREAVNTPVQGAAGLIHLMSLVVVDQLMQEYDAKSMLVNTVHDNTLTDVWPGELDDMAALQVDVMENIVEYAGEFMPNIDMGWLICPLKADVEVGSHYGSLKHYTVE